MQQSVRNPGAHRQPAENVAMCAAPSQQFNPTLDNAWEDMLDRRRRGIHRRTVADHDSEDAVVRRRAAGCAVDAAVVEEHGTAAEARVRCVTSAAAAEAVIAHLDELTHSLATAGVRHRTRQPPPDASSPAAFAAALARLLRLSGSSRGSSSAGPAKTAAAAASDSSAHSVADSSVNSSPPSLALPEPPAAPGRDQSDLLSAIMVSHTSSAGDGLGPLPDHSGGMPDHSGSALIAIPEPSADSLHRATPHSSSNPFRTSAASDSVSNPFLSPPPSNGYPQSSSVSSSTKLSSVSSIEIPIDPDGRLSHRLTTAEAQEAYSTGTLQASQRLSGAAAPPHSSPPHPRLTMSASASSSISTEMHELHACTHEFRTRQAATAVGSVGAALPVEPQDLQAPAAHSPQRADTADAARSGSIAQHERAQPAEREGPGQALGEHPCSPGAPAGDSLKRVERAGTAAHELGEFLSVASAPPPASSTSSHSPHLPTPRQQPPSLSPSVVAEAQQTGKAAEPVAHATADDLEAEAPVQPAAAVIGEATSHVQQPSPALSGMNAVAVPDAHNAAPGHVELSPNPSGHADDTPAPRPLSPAMSDIPAGRSSAASSVRTASPPPSEPAPPTQAAARASPPLRPPPQLSGPFRPAPQPALRPPPLPLSSAAAAPQPPTTLPAHRIHGSPAPFHPKNPTTPSLPHPSTQRAESSSVSFSSSSSLAHRPLADTATLRDAGATSSSINIHGEISLIGDSGALMHGDSAATTDSGPGTSGSAARRHPAPAAQAASDSAAMSGESDDIATLSFAQQLRQTVEAAEAGGPGAGRSGSAALSDVTTPRLPSAPASLFNTDSASALLSPRPDVPAVADKATSSAVAAAAAAAARHAVPPLQLQGPPHALGIGSPLKPTRDLNRLFQEPAAQRAAAAWHVRRPASVAGAGFMAQRQPARHPIPQSHPTGASRTRMTMREPPSDLQRRAAPYRVEPPSASHPAAHMRSSPLYLRPSDNRNPVALSDSPTRQGLPFPRQPSPLQPAPRTTPRRSPRLAAKPAHGHTTTTTTRTAGAPALRTMRRAETRAVGSPAARASPRDTGRSGVRGRSTDPAPCYSPRPFAPDDSYSMPERGLRSGESSDDGSGGGRGGDLARPRKRSRGRDRLTSGDEEFFSVAELIRGRGLSQGHYPNSDPRLRPPATTGAIRTPNPYRGTTPQSAAAAVPSAPPPLRVPSLFPQHLLRYAPVTISARQPTRPAHPYGAFAPASTPPAGATYIPPLPRLPRPDPVDPSAAPPPVPRGVPPGLNLAGSLSSQSTAHSGSARSSLRPPKPPSAIPLTSATPNALPRESSSPTGSLTRSGSIVSSIPSNFLPPLMPPIGDEQLSAHVAIQAAVPSRENNAFASGVLDLARETEATTAQVAGVASSSGSATSRQPHAPPQRQQSIDGTEKASVSSSMMFWDEESPGRRPPASPLPQVPERSVSGEVRSPAASPAAPAAEPPRGGIRAAAALRQQRRTASASPTRQLRSGAAAAPALQPASTPIPAAPVVSTPPTSSSTTELRPAYWAVVPSERSGSASGEVSPNGVRSLLYTLPSPASGVSFARTPSSSSNSGSTPLTPMDLPASINSNAAARRLSARTGELSTMSGTTARAFGTHSTSAGTLPPAPPSAERPAAAYGRVAVWPQATAAHPLSGSGSAAVVPQATLQPVAMPAAHASPASRPVHVNRAASQDASTLEQELSAVGRELTMAATLAIPPRRAASPDPPVDSIATGTDTMLSGSASARPCISSPVAGRTRGPLISSRAESEVVEEPHQSVCSLRRLFSAPRVDNHPRILRGAPDPRQRPPQSLQGNSGSPGFHRLLHTTESQSTASTTASPSLSASTSLGGRTSRPLRGGPQRVKRRHGRIAAPPPPPPPPSLWRHCLCLRGRDGVYDV